LALQEVCYKRASGPVAHLVERGIETPEAVGSTPTLATMTIDRFDGEHEFLSNFYEEAPWVQYDGVSYQTTEHAFQAAKTLDPLMRRRIREAPNAGAAKKLGRGVVLRPGWDSLRIIVMRHIVGQKFSRAVLGHRLCETHPAKLVE